MFYVFRIPAVWQPYMSFNCGTFHPPGLGKPQRLCARVLGMGWLSSVGVAQHLIRELALRAPKLGAGLPLHSELRRDCDPPRRRHKDGGERFWSVYMDDFDVAEANEKEETLRKWGRCTLGRRQYEKPTVSGGSPAEKKRPFARVSTWSAWAPLWMVERAARTGRQRSCYNSVACWSLPSSSLPSPRCF